MTRRTLTRLYDRYDTVAQVVHRLELAGVPDRDISVITSNVDSRYPRLAEAAQGAADPVSTGALTCGVIGGCFGALLGIGALDWPGFETIAQLGWFPALLIGAVLGAMLGTIIGVAALLFRPRDPALAYARGISQGNPLLTVRVDRDLVPRVAALMGIDEGAGQPDGSGAAPDASAAEAATGYGMGGWSRFEPGIAADPTAAD